MYLRNLKLPRMFKLRVFQALFLGSALATLLPTPSLAQEAPPTTAGGIGNSDLQHNKAVINSQGVGAVIMFMTEGSKTCDENGQNCRSLFGEDDSFDAATASAAAQKYTGSNSLSFLGSEDEANNIASQVGELVVICGDDTPHIAAGVALKVTNCVVTTSGDAQLSFRVCSAPMRGIPVSLDEGEDRFYPGEYEPKSCDSEPEGSRDGWSSEHSLYWRANLPETASAETKQNNGLAMVFYPDLSSGVIRSVSADSDTLTVVKVVQTALHPETGLQAIGMKVVYRHKTKFTKEMMTDGVNAVSDPASHTTQWVNVKNMGMHPMLSPLQEETAKNSTACLQALHEGLATRGEVGVCDSNYVGAESGLRPIGLTAKIGVGGQECSSTTQCIREVVNVNSWVHTCYADVPLSTRECSIVTDYTMEDIHSKRTRSTDICTEKRAVTQHTCNVIAETDVCSRGSAFDMGGIDFYGHGGIIGLNLLGENRQTNTRYYRLGSTCVKCLPTGYYSTSFDVVIKDVGKVDRFHLYDLGYDDQLYISVNGVWVWKHAPGHFYFNQARNQWGAYRGVIGSRWTNAVEWSTNWRLWNSPFRYVAPLDLRPYLREGKNTVRVDIGVVDQGEGWFDFEVSGWSANCPITVQNECAAFEAASN